MENIDTKSNSKQLLSSQSLSLVSLVENDEFKCFYDNKSDKHSILYYKDIK
jgi:hypothetical protein